MGSAVEEVLEPEKKGVRRDIQTVFATYKEGCRFGSIEIVATVKGEIGLFIKDNLVHALIEFAIFAQQLIQKRLAVFSRKATVRWTSRCETSKRSTKPRFRLIAPGLDVG
ncbi:MAG: hypothetical protein PHU33_13680 [Bacteroidales bacterium]|nr:hypothetical protein [Bacteroidales bacterium]